MKPPPTSTNSPYLKLPPLIGIATFDEAKKPGLSVETCVKRLKRFHYAFWRIHQICIAHIAEESVYELKMAFSYHAHLAAEMDTLFRARVGEMREPPLGLEKSQHPALDVFFDEILTTPSTKERLAGLYRKALLALREGLQRYIAETHPLADNPSRRICRQALMDVEDMCEWGAQAVAAFGGDAGLEESSNWLSLLDVCLASAGGLDGAGKMSQNTEAPVRHYSSTAFVFDGTPRRDERFPDPYNRGVNAEAFLYDEEMPPDAKVLMMFYKRIREIDVPEMMSSILHETKGKPWSYYRDMTRQLWDEARHAMIGEVGFVSEGIDWPCLVMVNSTWSRALNTQLTPKERHAVLYFIEQGLMPKTGKRHEWVVSKEAGNPLATTFQDFDWADEVLHARIGRDWYVADMTDAKEAIDYGDTCWAKVLVGWSDSKKQGLTEHRNWWPELYRTWCAQRGITPDARAEAFAETYESKRPDLKTLPVSV
ncbi:MAG: hypothetical protein EBY32_07770 [Proteobacteria bacterium]|nr:hypothetical protein [Pseudomonadota bacterium]